MTTVTSPAPARARTTDEGIRLGFARVLRSETIKLLTLRSTWWSIIVVALLSVALSALIAASIAASMQQGVSATDLAHAVPMAVIAPIQFTMLLAGSLGAIAITGEYSTGMIRSTLAAEPRRGVVLAAKTIVVAALLAVVSLVVFALALIPVCAILKAAPLDVTDPGTLLLPVLYGCLSMAVFAVLGLSFGFILRNGPGAIAATAGLLFVLPIVGSMFPSEGAWSWLHTVAAYLPMNAAQALTTTPGEHGMMTVPVALLTLGGWVAAGLVGSWLVLRTRDA
ncbi:ABC transporter permease subunit [Microbacterium luticocti]|uniref:ABC transporter permease subunit n=1 Tax=Microbacterium luticocti TaxID=451764 RepID=UPI00040E1301|nr:ABC transporter permease subunit [Microbacterium luticocti]